MESVFLQLCALCLAAAVLSAARIVLGRADTGVPTVTGLGGLLQDPAVEKLQDLPLALLRVFSTSRFM